MHVSAATRAISPMTEVDGCNRFGLLTNRLEPKVRCSTSLNVTELIDLHTRLLGPAICDSRHGGCSCMPMPVTTVASTTHGGHQLLREAQE